MAKGNENVLGVSIGKDLIDRLKKQAVRETAKHQRPVTVTEIVKDAVEEYLGYWETGIDAAEFHKTEAGANPDDPADPGKELRDLVQDCVSPEAAAVMATALLGAKPTGDDAVDRGVRWFAKQLTQLLGGRDRVNDVLAGLGYITIDRR